MAATIKQIAQELGISASTVSRALSDFAYVSKETREKVVRKAKELDYAPNLWAQNLVGARTDIIGCLVLELANPFYIPMVQAIEDFTNQHELITFLGETRRDLETEKFLIERFRRVRAAGVILTPVLSDLKHLKDLENEGVPVVVAGRTVRELDSINIDNIESGSLAARHLVEEGYTSFGYVQSGDKYNFPEHERLVGYKEFLQTHSHDVSSIYTVGNNQITGGEKAGDEWLYDENRPNAVFCSNDMLAMGFIQSLVRLGVRIPDDVAVIGHDDIPFADNFIVPISTIVLPKYEMGQLAANVLQKRIQSSSKRHAPQFISLDPSLVVRDSTKRN